MDALIIRGPAKLEGKIEVSGSKNTALPLLFASLLFDEELHYENVPRLWDVETTLKLLESMGAEYSWHKEEGRVRILPKVRERLASYDWVKKMRAGILALGPLLAKYGEARVSLPGGCAIGARPVNFHLDAIKKLGATVSVENGYIHATAAKPLQGTRIVFPEVTVTGTENLLCVAVLAQGKTQIINAALEPEVIQLGRFLMDCGARIQGLGTATIEIEGVAKLTPPKLPIRVPADRIEAGTWIAIATATRSPLELLSCPVTDMDSVFAAYSEMGVRFEISGQDGTVYVVPPEKLKPLDIETQPYPGFPTDMQAQVLVNLCLASGTSTVKETIFENRFMHVAELKRLGANIRIHGNVATVEGPALLRGAPMMATDLRASACLVVAALAAVGETKISRIYHLDRGYQRLDEKLRKLGADIERISDA